MSLSWGSILYSFPNSTRCGSRSRVVCTRVQYVYHYCFLPHTTSVKLLHFTLQTACHGICCFFNSPILTMNTDFCQICHWNISISDMYVCVWIQQVCTAFLHTWMYQVLIDRYVSEQSCQWKPSHWIWFLRSRIFWGWILQNKCDFSESFDPIWRCFISLVVTGYSCDHLSLNNIIYGTLSISPVFLW